LQLTVQN